MNYTVISQYACGCQLRLVYLPDRESYIIEYCPKHNAAQDMYEELKKIRNLMYDFKMGQIRRDEIEKVLAKAEGKEGG